MRQMLWSLIAVLAVSSHAGVTKPVTVKPKPKPPVSAPKPIIKKGKELQKAHQACSKLATEAEKKACREALL